MKANDLILLQEIQARCILFILGYKEDVGEKALFNRIVTLFQVNETYYLITDHYNHCLREVKNSYTANEAGQWRTSTFAGKCTSLGDTVGTLLNTRFSFPTDIKQYADVLFVADSYNKKIKKIDLAQGVVSTFHESDNYEPQYLSFGAGVNDLYATADHGILYISGGRESWLVGSRAAGSRTGQFSSADFNGPQDIKQITRNILLVADANSHTLKMVDTESMTVQQLCTGQSFRHQVQRYSLSYIHKFTHISLEDAVKLSLAIT